MSDPIPSRSPSTEPTWRESMTYPLGTLGAMIGAGLGAALTALLVHYGFYAVIAIGVLTGIGATVAARRRGGGGWTLALLTAAIALTASLCTEWKLFPFIADDSLGYFLTHLGSLTTFSLLSQAANAVIAGFIAFRR